PAAHRGTNHDLWAAAKLLEHGHALFQPAADGALDELAAGFAMAGIVETHADAAMLGRPGIERQRLGASHVRVEAAEPEQPGRDAGTGAHGDPAHGTALTDLDKGGIWRDGRKIGHGYRSNAACRGQDHEPTQTAR